MAKEIKTEILIHAAPEKVWNILTDFKNYARWNPFITSIHGEAKAGNLITVSIVPPGKKGIKLRPKVLVVAKNIEFRWKGRLIIPGLFDGEHIFELIDNKNGSTTFIQRELFAGILVPFLTKMLDNNTVNGFKRMNQALKGEVEKLQV